MSDKPACDQAYWRTYDSGSFKNKATMAHVLPDTVLAEMHRGEAEHGTAKK